MDVFSRSVGFSFVCHATFSLFLSGNMHGCPRATSSDISEMTWDQGWKVDDVPYRHKGGGSPSVNEDNQRILTTVFIAFVFIVSPYRVFPTERDNFAARTRIEQDFVSQAVM